jgi:hypothetical protein
MVHNEHIARKHYLSIIDARGTYAERRVEARRAPRLGFVSYRELYQQPYGVPTQFVTEVEPD